MLLAQKFMQFEQDFQAVCAAKKELESQITEDALKEKLKDSFECLKQELKDILKQEASATLAKERNQLREANEAALGSLFAENLEYTAEALSHKINLNTLSAQIAKNLESKNQKQIIQLLREALEGEKYQRQVEQCAQTTTQEISRTLTSFKSKIAQKSEELTQKDALSLLQSLAQEFLRAHKDEILKSQNLNFLKNLLAQDDSLKSLVLKDVKIATREIAKSAIEKEIKGIEKEIKGLDSCVLDTILKNLPTILTESLPEVGRIRFQGALHLQALGLQSQIAFLQSTLLKLHELRAAKLGIVHNVLKAH